MAMAATAAPESGPESAPAAVTTPAAAPAPAAGPAAIRIAVLLPGKMPAYADVVQAIKAGMQDAAALAPRPVALQFIDTDDDPDAIGMQLQEADHDADLIIGPLTRSAVNRLAGAVAPIHPVLMLNAPEGDAATATSALPSGRLLYFSLSLEAEARQNAETVLGLQAERRARIQVLSAPSALYRRVAQAFLRTLQERGTQAEWLESEDTTEVHRAAHEASVAFIAGDAAYAARVRPFVPRPALVFATSHVHSDNPALAAAKHDLEGICFTDLPWLIDRESPAVLAYLRPDRPGQPAYGFDTERLYAFGVDSLRLGLAWLESPRIALEGVTGRLQADAEASPWVARHLGQAVLKDGTAQRLEP
jgi:outer membrane PBP1 activator LpoA protein